MSHAASPHLEFTDARFVYAGKSYPGIPLLVDSKDRFAEPVCEYLRNLVIMEHLRTSSTKTYAECLLQFWRYLESNNVDYRDVDDHLLNQWLNQQEANGVSTNTRAARCDAVFDFFAWMERNSYVCHMVRIPGWNDTEKFTPQLTAVAAMGNSMFRRASRFGIVSGVRPRGSKGEDQPTPTSDEVSRIYIVADNRENAELTERNHLLIDWYVQVGVRREEWSALTKDQIPNWEEIYSLQQCGEAYELRLTKTKGGRVRHVGVLPELLQKTREYIEGPRATLVARFKRKQKSAYREPAEVFLSDKTGLSLKLTAISNLLTGWFKKAGVPGHGHRLRASYLINLFEAELAAEESRIAAHPGTKSRIDYEIILRKVAERAGHAHVESLRPYLTLVRKRRLREPGVANLVTLDQRIAAKLQELALLEHRIAMNKGQLQLTKSATRTDSRLRGSEGPCGSYQHVPRRTI